MAGFGIVMAAQRARAWMPRLATPGQRLILSGLVVYMGADSVSHPSVGQLAEFTGFAPRSVSRLLTELVDLDVIAPGDLVRSKGRSPTRWTIRPCPGSQGSTLTGESGSDSSTLTGETPTLTGERANPDPIGSPLETLEKIEKQPRCATHSFEERAIGFTYCSTCGISEKSIEEEPSEALERLLDSSVDGDTEQVGAVLIDELLGEEAS